MKTSYILAIHGQPLTTFRTMVAVQKANGVQLLSKTDTVDKAREFVKELAGAVRHKIKDALTKDASFFSILSDGSQARKTGSEKELVYVRALKSGLPVFYCVSLQNIDNYGDANAENLKRSIDNTFQSNQQVVIPHEAYKNKLVSMTADGASVNMGAYNGLLVRMANEDRPWLVPMHCVSHRVELALKDSLGKEFDEVKQFMTLIYYSFKSSGKFRRHFYETAHILGVHVYNFPKVHGTRFIAHLLRGVDHLLNNWIVLAQAIENSLATCKDKAKLLGILNRLKNFNFLAKSCLYKDLLTACSALSLQFEKHDLLCYQILPSVAKTYDALNERLEEVVGPHCVDLANKFGIKCTLDEESNVFSIESNLMKSGHHRRLPQNREYQALSYKMIHFHQSSNVISKIKGTSIPQIKKCLETRFTSFDTELFRSMMWLDPANWGDTENEVKCLHFLAEKFATSLSANNFDLGKVKSEWIDLKRTVNFFMRGTKCKDLWERIFMYRRQEFPNVSLLAEIVMCIGVSNSVVESGFSFLTSMLTDRRLSLSHQTMENLLIIKINDFVWTNEEKDELIEVALKNYMTSKRRKRKLETNIDSTHWSQQRKVPTRDEQIPPMDTNDTVPDDGDNENDGHEIDVSDHVTDSDYEDEDVDKDTSKKNRAQKKAYQYKGYADIDSELDDSETEEDMVLYEEFLAMHGNLIEEKDSEDLSV